jgi:hypothetical protein
MLLVAYLELLLLFFIAALRPIGFLVFWREKQVFHADTAMQNLYGH